MLLRHFKNVTSIPWQYQEQYQAKIYRQKNLKFFFLTIN